MKILAIIPAYNEETTISQIILGIKKYCSHANILVINDGSSDNTAARVEAQKVFLINLPFNLGIGTAVQTGFKYAQSNNYDLAFQIDADGQHLPKEINRIILPLKQKKIDIVIGSRFLDKNNYRKIISRRIGTWIFQLIHQLLLNKHITDSTSGFRAYNKKAINFLANNYPDDYPEPEAIIILIKNGFNIKEVPVEMDCRKGGKSSIKLTHAIYYMIKVILAIMIQSLQKVEIND